MGNFAQGNVDLDDLRKQMCKKCWNQYQDWLADPPDTAWAYTICPECPMYEFRALAISPSSDSGVAYKKGRPVPEKKK